MTFVVVALAALAAWCAVGRTAEERTRRLSGVAPISGMRGRLRDQVGPVTGRIGLGPSSRRRRAGERVRVIQAIGALAAELESGQPPTEALRRSVGDPPVWPAALAAIGLDGDVPSALEVDAATSPLLGQLSACWRVAAGSGAGLAPTIARLAESARAAEDVRIDLEGQLAGPRATARMLAVLPLVGIGFGVMLGADPITWLLATSFGRICLAGGILLTLAGMWWTGRIAAAVEKLL